MTELQKTAVDITQLVSISPKSGQNEVIDGKIQHLCDLFRAASQEERGTLRLSHDVRAPLLAFAWRAAARALRVQSAQYIVDGLTALAIEGGRVDIRDDIMRMAALFHSAETLGASSTRLFDDASALMPGTDLAEELRRFPLRDSAHRDLSAFGTELVQDNDGVAYRFVATKIKSRRWWPFG